ncbi:carbohydrate kinase family protein [Roseomonas sp. BN140053]|uniref:carbohydrate kinase family protein n=1 Tax=Roseomonas sp. BN140053 TaxID=3391898 RepID=UPI0039EC8C2F
MRDAPRLLVVGYLSIDALAVPGARWDSMPGGAALYAALGARRAGARVTLAAAVGEDFPPAWLDMLAAMGLDLSGVQRRPGATRRARLQHGTAGERASPHHGDPAWHERSEAMLPCLPASLDGFDAAVAGPVPPVLLPQLLAAATCPVVADTSEVFAALECEAVLAALPGLTAFAPSIAETRLLLPELDDDAAARSLAARGPCVLQKRGAAGALAVAGGVATAIPAPPARVVDPTGAGDATVGALAALLAAGLPFTAAARQAMEVGAAAVSAPGPAALGFAPSPRNPEPTGRRPA